MKERATAEFLGTMWLVLGGCGSAVLAAAFPQLGIAFHGVALAFGLTVVSGAYAFGTISGGHFNPAVTLGLTVAGRFSAKDLPAYWAAQVAGGIAGAGVLYLIASGKAGFTPGGFASNGFGEHSPGGYGMNAALVCEVVMTFFFLIVILGVTAKKGAHDMAGVAIGLCLTLIHLISIPVTNTSVNPARSTAVALFAEGGWAMPQLWLFWVAPLAGAALAGFVFPKALSRE